MLSEHNPVVTSMHSLFLNMKSPKDVKDFLASLLGVKLELPKEKIWRFQYTVASPDAN